MAEVHLGADVSEKQPLSYASSTLEVETMCHSGQLRSANCRKASNAIAQPIISEACNQRSCN